MSEHADAPIIHEVGCAWETGPYCTCGADPERSAENGALAGEPDEAVTKHLTTDAPHVEVQWAVDMGFAVSRARDEEHARQWAKGYEDNPDAVTDGDPMPVAVHRTVTTSAWTRVTPPGGPNA